MLARLFAVFALVLAFATPALAQTAPKIASVDFQRALNEVSEGKAASARLQGMMAEKEKAVEQMRGNLEKLQADYEKQQVILSDAARKQKEEELYTAQMQFQQAYARHQGEMQQAYYGAMETLIEKMRKLAQTIGTEKGYTLIIEVNEGGVVYTSPTIDITDELIKRYNTANPGK
ncbi:MAG: OmpH family outer membrane protein [Myxococcota bacterium]